MTHPVLIGVAWPYANGRLHLGHVAGNLLPPDIFRRYCRMQGHPTLMVSGSDCHGTPILLQAEKEGVGPADIVDRFHADHVEALRRMDIGFDLYTTTRTDNHIALVQKIFLAALDQGFIEKRTMSAPYDPKAARFLPDRYVEGTCPHCDQAGARGDQCDHCGKTLDPNELKDPHSKLNPDTAIEFRDTDHYFFLLSKLQPALERYTAEHGGHWRPQVLNFTQNWLREGLKDRAITRDLTWGVPVPVDGFEDKRIYVWFEAVCGYLSATMEWAQRGSDRDASRGGDQGRWGDLPAGSHTDQGAPPPTSADAWMDYWCAPDAKVYNFLGKDNIPFHTIIWPGILTAFNAARTAAGEKPLNLPFDVAAQEFLNLSGQQFSKSRGITISVHDVLDRYEADAVRYYLAVNMPEQRDTDWTWEDFLAKVNDELVGIVGNLAHRVLSFTQKNLGTVPDPPTDFDLEKDVVAEIEACGRDMAIHMDAVRLKRGLRRLVEFAGWGNQVMQEAAPWKLLKEDPAAGRHTLYALLRIVKALALYMAPFMPAAAERAWQMLGEPGSVHDAAWSDAAKPLQSGQALEPPKALFRKLDPKALPGAASDEAEGAAKQAAGKAGTGDKAGKGESSAKAAKAGKGGPQPKAQTRADREAEPADGLVSIDDFARIQLRLATVTSVDEHPKADKLYVLKLDVGELGERQVVAGLKAHYAPQDLVGQTVAFVANLKPAKLRGVESQGMILAADTGEGAADGVAVLNPQRPLPAGSRIR